MKKIVFITPRDAEHGFHLAGVMQYVISATETEDTLRRVMKETDTGIVVIDERLMEGIDERKIREMEDRWYGIFLILPAPEKGIEVEDYAVRLIKRAIGYHVRLGQ